MSKDEPDAHDAAVVPMRACDLCAHVLDRARHLLARAAPEFDPAAQATALRRRLAPDMFDLGQQATVLADSLVGAAALLAGRTHADEPAVQWVFNRGDEASLGVINDLGASVSVGPTWTSLWNPFGKRPCP